MPVDAIPGRMALLVTLLLVMINTFNSSLDAQPHTDGISAMSGNTISNNGRDLHNSLTSISFQPGYCHAFSLFLDLYWHMLDYFTRNFGPKPKTRYA